MPYKSTSWQFKDNMYGLRNRGAYWLRKQTRALFNRRALGRSIFSPPWAFRIVRSWTSCRMRSPSVPRCYITFEPCNIRRWNNGSIHWCARRYLPLYASSRNWREKMGSLQTSSWLENLQSWNRRHCPGSPACFYYANLDRIHQWLCSSRVRTRLYRCGERDIDPDEG